LHFLFALLGLTMPGKKGLSRSRAGV